MGHAHDDQPNLAGRHATNGPAYPDGVPWSVRLSAGLVLLLVGVALGSVAVLGARSRLPRNRYAGVRTAATLHSGQAFVLANRVAAPLVGAAGAVLLAASGVLLAGAPDAVAWTVLAIAVVGAFVLAGLGGLLGDRAAVQFAAAGPGSAGCAGACAGCDRVAGCRRPD